MTFLPHVMVTLCLAYRYTRGSVNRTWMWRHIKRLLPALLLLLLHREGALQASASHFAPLLPLQLSRAQEMACFGFLLALSKGCPWASANGRGGDRASSCNILLDSKGRAYPRVPVLARGPGTPSLHLAPSAKCPHVQCYGLCPNVPHKASCSQGGGF